MAQPPVAGNTPMAAGAENDEAGIGADGAVLSIRDLRQVYNAGRANEREAISNISFAVQRGEFVCIVGPSGAGKTTLLRCLSGLLSPTSGDVFFEGRRLEKVPDRLSVVFQDYSRSLFPWFTVAGNVAIPLKVAGVKRVEREARIAEVLRAVGLDEVGKHYPWQLSGGMQQRVAIARSLAHQPDLLLMDEPFASVDAQTRFELEDLILRVRVAYHITVVLVTHDIDEALYLADRVVVLSDSPSRVRAVLDVPLERPRNQLQTRSAGQFGELRGQLLKLVTE
jgi:NitT/TauT family transport system ATP-binding protein